MKQMLGVFLLLSAAATVAAAAAPPPDAAAVQVRVEKVNYLVRPAPADSSGPRGSPCALAVPARVGAPFPITD